MTLEVDLGEFTSESVVEITLRGKKKQDRNSAYTHSVLLEKKTSTTCTQHPVSYTHLDVYKRQVKRCSKLDRIKNEVIREELQVFNMNSKLKDCKQQWKEHLE